ncbi:threonine ammonia-lyase [Piscinibacter sp.]|uniref:threonine ammonia-lyase n=1 Tax=Piscinibacter sp. TaxID=1903157 RepID=UPI002D0A8B22|nr:pyridoxal-phosphate dependent enzyme [Albitalea sp.]HUG24169.1 pyridoxal-phosphate dependent enzyme [Albitalea sp.]
MSLADTQAQSCAYPTLEEIHGTAARLAGKVLETPVWRWQTGIAVQALGPATEVWLKLELFQHTGSFKLRGALNCVAALDRAALRRGVVACSAGNHAMAVASAARAAGTHAKLAMPRHASPARVAACRADGADVLLTDTIHDAFALAQQLVTDEGRTMIHPFDGPLTAQGTATVGLELMAQVPGLDAVIVPVGGGGLCGGVAAAVKQVAPQCQVFGVEPVGADAMARSFEAGRTVTLDTVDTVADSLGAPYALPYSFGVCRRFVDDIVRVSDDELCRAMLHLYRDMKLVAEPAAAAATAALLGPLRERLDGKRVALIVCGSNVDPQRFMQLLARAIP